MSSAPPPENVPIPVLEEEDEDVSTLEELRTYIHSQGVAIGTPFLSVLNFCFYGNPIDFRSVIYDLACAPEGIPYIIGIEEAALPEETIEEWREFLSRVGGCLRVPVITLLRVPSDLCQRVLAFQERADLRKSLRGPMKGSV